MRGFNQIFLIGNCAADPSLQNTKNGKPFLHFPIAVERDGKEATAEKAKAVDYHKVIIWGTIAEKLEKLIQKGTRLFISGCLRNNSYEANEEKKYFTEVHADQIEVLTFKKEAPAV